MSNKPPRAERERELRAMMQTDRGRLVEMYKQAEGIPMGHGTTPGMLLGKMIETILNKEYGPQPQAEQIQ